LRGRLGLVVDL